MNVEIDFAEKTLNEIERAMGKAQAKKLGRSKPVKAWLKFYDEWFGIKNIDLTKNNIGHAIPGARLVLVPAEITLEKLLAVMAEKGILRNGIKDPDRSIPKLRNRKSTYILHASNHFTVLEHLLIEALHMYQHGEFIPYGHSLVGRYAVRMIAISSDEVVMISSYNDENQKRIRLNVYIQKR